MTDPTLKQITFDEWAIDVTCAKHSGAIAFVPICGDEVVTLRLAVSGAQATADSGDE